MIAADQFTNIPDDLLFRFSSRSDGTVLDRSQPTHAPPFIATRQAICDAAGIRYDDVVYQRVIYNDNSTYDVIKEVTSSDTTQYIADIAADGLFTRQPGVGLFLPVADCIVTVIYDPKCRFLAQLHMGRHSTLTSILEVAVNLFTANGSTPGGLQVWMAPSVTKAHYRLKYFDQAADPAWKGFAEHRDDGYYLDMQGFNKAKLMSMGVESSNITISSIDTFENQDYFSHFRGDTGGRFAGLSMMRSLE